MAAPVFVQASTGSTDATGGWQHIYNSSGTGNLLVLQVLQDGATSGAITITTGSDFLGGVEKLDGTDYDMDYVGQFAVGSPTVAYQHIWIGRVRAAGNYGYTGGNASPSEDVYVRIYEFSSVNTGTTLADVIEQNGTTTPSTTSGTSGTIEDAGVTTTGPDRLALNFIAISDDNAIASFTGETGGDWTEAVAEYADSGGTDGSIGLQTAYTALDATGYSTTADYAIYGAGGDYFEEVASAFTPGSSCSLVGVTVYVNKVGSPADNLIVEVQTDSGGSPSGTAVGSGSVAGTSLGTSDARTEVTFSASLTGSTPYWVVLRRSGARDETNYYNWAYGSVYAADQDENQIKASGSWALGGTFALAFYLRDSVGGTIDGGTTANADATDGWGCVGFALIGTTVATKSLLRPHRYHLIRR